MDRYKIALASTLLLGGIFQYLVLMSSWTEGDEGQYMQGALAVTRHGFPLVTFAARPDSLNLLLFAPAVALFGPSVVVGRTIVVLFNIATALVVAEIARRVVTRHGGVAGIASAGIYLFSPLIASLDVRVIEEPMAAFFIMLGIFFFLRDKWAPARWNLPLAGGLLGLAILTRRSALAIGGVWLVWLLVTQTTWRSRLSRIVECFAPGIVIVLGFYLYVAGTTSFAWALDNMAKNPTFPYGQITIPLAQRLEIVGYMVALAPSVGIFPLVLGIRKLRQLGREPLVGLVAMVSTTTVISLLVALPFLADFGVGEYTSPYLGYVAFLTVVVWFAVLGREILEPTQEAFADGRVLLLLAACAGAVLLLDYLPRAQDFTAYLADVFAPMAILGGIWVSTLVPSPLVTEDVAGPKAARPRLRTVRSFAWVMVCVTLLVVSSAASAVLVLGPTDPFNVPGPAGLPSESQENYPLAEIQDVGNYLQRTVGPKETAFSFDPNFLDAANIPNSPQISIYIDAYLSMFGNAPNNVSPYPSAPPGVAPSLDQLLSYWNSTQLQWVVEGSRTIMAEAHSPLLRWYYNSFFHPVMSFGDPLSYDFVAILERGAPPTPDLQVLQSAAAPGTPSSVTMWNGTLYSGSLQSSNITYLTAQGRTGSLPLPFTGVSSLAGINGALWVGSSRSPEVEVLPLDGRPGVVIPSGFDPSAFDFDPVMGATYVASFSSGQVTAVDWYPANESWREPWTVGFGTAVTGVAVDPVKMLLYAALPYQNSVGIASTRTGQLVAVTEVPFAPFSMNFSNGGLSATWWGHGTVFRLGIGPGYQLRVETQVLIGGSLSEMTSVPSLNALIVPGAGVITVLNATNLLVLGTFNNTLCPEYAAWDPFSSTMGLVSSCTSTLSLVSFPAPVTVRLHGPPGAVAIIDGDDFASISLYDPYLEVQLWPQEITVSLTMDGYLPGFTDFTLTNSTPTYDLYLVPGPSLSGIAQMQNDFTMEVVVTSVLAEFALLALIEWGRTDPRSEPTVPSPEQKTGP